MPARDDYFHFVKLAYVFVTMSLLGGAGAAVGSMVGHGLGRGGLLGGGFLGGMLLVIGGGFLVQRLGWIRRSQRFWTNAGGVAGFFLACMMALATLSSPVGPILSTFLIGSGAVLGALVGHSAHDQA
jgi:hypothetical protein